MIGKVHEHFYTFKPEWEIRERKRVIHSERPENGLARQAAIGEREAQGLSLADIRDRTGIERSTLSRLENDETDNPTISTLMRYAEAVGKDILIILADRPEKYPV